MLRNLQGAINSVDSQYKMAFEGKRGMFVNKKHADKTAVLPTNIEEVYLVDRGIVTDAFVATYGVVSDYDTLQETVKKDEFVGLITPVKGERWATDAYSGADADFDVDKYLKVDATTGKLVASVGATKFKSLGFVMDNGHKLVGFEVVA